MSDCLILLLSCLYVSLVLLLARVLQGKARAIYIRKIVHILVSFWIVPCFSIDSLPLRLLGPLLFVILNCVACKRKGWGSGLVTYPLTLTLLIALEAAGIAGRVSVIGAVLVMGLGDGLAAIAGTALGHEHKSLPGFSVMALVSFSVLLILSRSWLSLPSALLVAAIEYFTPGGYDNITVPLSAAVLLEVLCAPLP